MRHSVLPALAAAGLAVATLPAQASVAGQSGSRDSAQQRETARDANAGERRICIRERLSGSHIDRPICKTRAEWEALGVLERGR